MTFYETAPGIKPAEAWVEIMKPNHRPNGGNLALAYEIRAYVHGSPTTSGLTNTERHRLCGLLLAYMLV